MDNVKVFGKLPDGQDVYEVTLRCGGISCAVITYGATLRTLKVPYKKLVPDGAVKVSNGEQVDIVLGFDGLDDYVNKRTFYGSIIGRFANRIGNSRFELNGVTYELPVNDGVNHLHGGILGFDRQNWEITEASDSSVTMHLSSPDGQDGYPGNLDVYVTYALVENTDEQTRLMAGMKTEKPSGTLRISYEARSDKDTLCSPTNHAYFNLSGHNGGPVADQFIQVFADEFTPGDAGLIPTGEIEGVEGTPMDLRLPVRIGDHIDDDFEQLVTGGGYDHNYVISGDPGEDGLKYAAAAYSEKTGVLMSVYTDRPGIQFYSGNFVESRPLGKGGAEYGKRHAFCLETQVYPDAPNKENFPSAVLKGGDVFKSTTEYRFSLTR